MISIRDGGPRLGGRYPNHLQPFEPGCELLPAWDDPLEPLGATGKTGELPPAKSKKPVAGKKKPAPADEDDDFDEDDDEPPAKAKKPVAGKKKPVASDDDDDDIPF